MKYNWAGDTIIRDTIMWNKRAVLGYQNVYIPTDIREWITNPDSEVIKRALQEMGLPSAREAGTFDLRAWAAWKYVAEKIQYVEDKAAFGIPDFWLFPGETLTLKKGDCEDSSFLLATLMLASGISEHCVRVVLGKVNTKDGSFGHAWVVYQDEAGVWSLLESTLNQVPPRFSPADSFTEQGSSNQYEPQFCLNASHLWWISPMKLQMADYLRSREKKLDGRAERIHF
jgi:hypothetical protein